MKGIAALFAALCIVRPHAKEREAFRRALEENREAGERVQRSLAFLRDIEGANEVLTGREGDDNVGNNDSQ